MKRIIAAILLCAIALFAFSACSVKDGGAETTANETTEDQTAGANMVPDFVVYTADGEKISLHDKIDKPVVLNFWATWCPPCKAEMPAFEAAYSKYGEKIEFMMVNMTDGQRDTVDVVKTFIEDNGYTFPVYCDKERDAAYTYAVQSIPMTVFIGSDGSLIDYHVGAMTEDALIQYIERMK